MNNKILLPGKENVYKRPALQSCYERRIAWWCRVERQVSATLCTRAGRRPIRSMSWSSTLRPTLATRLGRGDQGSADGPMRPVTPAYLIICRLCMCMWHVHACCACGPEAEADRRTVKYTRTDTEGTNHHRRTSSNALLQVARCTVSCGCWASSTVQPVRCSCPDPCALGLCFSSLSAVLVLVLSRCCRLCACASVYTAVPWV